MSNFGNQFLLPPHFLFGHIRAFWQNFLPPGNSVHPPSSYALFSHWLMIGETFVGLRRRGQKLDLGIGYETRGQIQSP
jgi:hypothetical protein